MRRCFVIISMLLLMTMSVTMAQANDYTLDEARALLREGRYSEAAPTFERELKRKSNNGSLNYSYGVCLYHMGNYPNAIKYLTKAASRKVHTAHILLGDIYTQLYHFDEALNSYNEYVATLEEETTPDSISHRIDRAKLGVRMLRGVEQVQVIDSLVVDSLTFFDYFKLSPESGRILASDKLPFALPIDTSVVAFMPQRNDIVYFGYKQDGAQYDLYQSSRLLGDEWSERLSLSENLNNEYNQRYPFLLGDGQTLYFAQDGDASLGGYDIFITMFNSEMGDFMLPQNVGMPFNSPYNDFMMAIDETLGVGWFVTDRNHIPGKLTLYIFIPNEVKKVYNDVEAEQLISLAQLSDITLTWQEDTTRYASIINDIHSIEVEDVVVSRDEFYFVVNDDIVYTRATDFRNQQALTYYYQALTLKRKIEERNNQLQQLRMKYANAKPQQRQLLSEQILELEALMLEGEESPLVYENRARRAELSFLNLLNE